MAVARLVLEVGTYRPITSVPKIKVPILFIAASTDKLCPVEKIQEALSRSQNGEITTLQCNHFQIYSGKFFDDSTDKQVKFIERVTGWSAQPDS